MLRFSTRPKLTILLQSEAAECGLASLAMVAGYHGYRATLSELRRRFVLSLKGTTLKTMIAIADGMGLAPARVRPCWAHNEKKPNSILSDRFTFMVPPSLKEEFQADRIPMWFPDKDNLSYYNTFVEKMWNSGVSPEILFNFVRIFA